MHVGHSWKQKPPQGKFDAIVIGSGMGGLACAAILSRHGKQRVLVLERHYRIGGYTHSFSRPGYDWDVGVHYIGQVGEKGALKPLFDRLTDGKLKWAQLPEVYDRVELGANAYDFPTGTGAFVEKLGAYFPQERDAISRYVELVKSTTRGGATFYMGRALPGPLASLGAGLFGRGFKEMAARSTLSVLRELTQDEELIAVLTGQYGDYGLPPSQSSFAMHAALVAHYLGGGFYPVGGAGQIAATIAPLIEENGGHLAVSAEVASVVVEGGKAVGVRLSSGEEVRAPLVISDAGVANTFGRLVPEAHRPAPWVSAVRTVQPSVSYVCLYLGFKHTDEQLGLNGTNLWLYPDRRHDENMARYLADAEAPFPGVYVSFPSAKDPDFARRHPGHATVDVITAARWDWFAQWKDEPWKKRSAGYESLKARFQERLLEVVYQRLPQLRGKVDFAELSTPLSAAHFSTHPRGELYGLDHGPARYALPLKAKTPLPGLLLTGADLVSCGVAGAAMGGVLTAGAILGPRVAMEMIRR